MLSLDQRSVRIPVVCTYQLTRSKTPVPPAARVEATKLVKRYFLLFMTVPAACTASAADPQYTLTTLATFHYLNGARPLGGLIADASGNLYGTAAYGGDVTQYDGRGAGVVFEVANNASHTLTTLATFNSTNGAWSSAVLIADPSGNLYGTTGYGGDLTLNNGFGRGTVFRVANDASHTVSTLATFNFTNGAIQPDRRHQW